jgi:hypothetical protein
MTAIVGGFASSRSQISEAFARGCERVDDRDLAAGLDDGRRHHRLPVEALLPGGMLDPPDPQARSDIANLKGHLQAVRIGV